MKKLLALSVLGVLAFSFALPLFAHAQGTGTGGDIYGEGKVTPPTTESGPLSGASGILDIFRKLLKAAAILFWILAVLFIFYAGYKYLTSAGDPKAVETANKQLLYAAVAIAVGLMAYGMPRLVDSVLRGQI